MAEEYSLNLSRIWTKSEAETLRRMYLALGIATYIIPAPDGFKVKFKFPTEPHKDTIKAIVKLADNAEIVFKLNGTP